MSSGVNQPNRIDAWVVEDGEKLLEIHEDPKIPNAATIILHKHDHTMGNMIRSQLLLDPSVLFAGYKVPHPLETDVEIKIQTDERSNPAEALKRACQSLIEMTTNIKNQWTEKARNIEMNMGLGGGDTQASGTAFDPYADGYTGGISGAQQGGQADVYDF